MDLSINRLKILGEEEIQRLDLKIEEYKNSNQSSILDKVAQKISHKNCQSIEDEEAQSGTEINSRATEPNIH